MTVEIKGAPCLRCESIAFLTNTKTPNRVFKDTDEAVTWLLTLPGAERLARERNLAAEVKAFAEG